jgi:hypothetical protein
MLAQVTLVRQTGRKKRLLCVAHVTEERAGNLTYAPDEASVAPDPKTRSAIRFWLDCLQAVTVIGGVITAVVTFRSYKI